MDRSDQTPHTGEAAFGPLPDLMDDVVHRQRRDALRARLFGAGGGTGDGLTHDRFGRYQLRSRLGSGASGVVHVAHDPVLDRRIALKILRHPQGDDRLRLLREAQALAQMTHPNVVEVFEVGERGSEVFLALELIDGVTLRQWSNERRRSWTEVLDVYLQAGRGLAAAHAHDLVHRDFKPDNAMRGHDGRVRVLDFGLARAAASREPSTEGNSGSLEQTHATLTGTGAVVGTPAYLAPERLEGSPADARSDQFALAVSIYEALYGERPFAGDTVPQLFTNLQANRRRARPEHAAVPRRIDAVLDRALAPNPDRRWPDVTAMVDALADARHGVQRRRSAKRWALGAGLVLGVTGVIGMTMRPSAQEPAVAPSCRTVPEQLAKAWTEPRRAALLARWTRADGQPPPTALTVLATLDDRAEGLATAWTHTCEQLDAIDDQEADDRMRCLERRAVDLMALLNELDQLPAERLRRALPLVESLPTHDCRHSNTELPVPTDPQRAKQVESIRSALRQAMNHCRLAGPRDCSEPLLQALEHARQIDHPPLLALALGDAGSMEEMRGDLAASEQYFEQAFFLARSIEDDDIAARAAIHLVHVVGYEGARSMDGLRWARQAHAVLGDDGDPKLRGDLFNNQGLIRMRLDHTDLAEQDYLRAIALYEQVPTPPLGALAIVQSNLAQVAYQRRELPRALELLGQAIALETERFGPDNLSIAQTLGNRSLIHMERGDLDAATDDLQHAMAIIERALGKDHSELFHLVSKLARIDAMRHDYRAAREHYTRALSLREPTDGEDPQRLRLEASLAMTNAKLDEPQRALEGLQRTLRQQQLSEDVSPLDTAATHQYLGDLRLDLAQPEHAATHYGRAISLVEDLRGPEEPGLAPLLTGRGECELALDRPDAALPLLERAWSVAEPSSRLPAARARTAFALARALAATNTQAPMPAALATRIQALVDDAHRDYTESGPSLDRQARAVARWRSSALP